MVLFLLKGDRELMKLKKLKLQNFRGYKKAEILFDENISIIVGKNDVGKSTIMDALEVFFNGDSRDAQVKVDIDDLNVNCTEEKKEIRITCCFHVGDEEVLIDSINRTNLEEEFLLNEEGLLEVSKVWNCFKAKINASDLKTNISAHHPGIFEKPLVTMKIQDLRKKLEEIKDDLLEYENINKNKSADIRKALYQHYVKEDTTFVEIDIDILKEDAKNIWESIKTNLPLLFLFKSDRTNTADDAEVQNPLKIATKSALANLNSILEEVKVQVENEVRKIGEKTIEKLSELDTSIASSLTTDLKLKPWDSVFSFDLISDNGIPLNKRGSGVRRLLLLSYFRAEAERLSQQSSSKDIIYAIEEPETSQHPDYQKMIIESLMEISSDERHQVILTTHTPEIAKMANINQLIFIKKDEEGIPNIVDSELKIQNIVNTLGILPSITSKVVVCVEGENDVNFLRNINKCIKEYRNIIDIEKERINIIPLTGSNLKRWVDENYLKDSNVKEIHIYDNDRADYKAKIEEINNMNDGRRIGWVTNKREMENYISPTLIEQELAIDLCNYKENWSDIDVPKLLVGKVMLHIHDVAKREKELKVRLNSSISKKINKEYLDEIGAYDEIEEWFLKIKEVCEQ